MVRWRQGQDRLGTERVLRTRMDCQCECRGSGTVTSSPESLPCGCIIWRPGPASLDAAGAAGSPKSKPSPSISVTHPQPTLNLSMLWTFLMICACLGDLLISETSSLGTLDGRGHQSRLFAVNTTARRSQRLREWRWNGSLLILIDKLPERAKEQTKSEVK